jgi:hypothetical protein
VPITVELRNYSGEVLRRFPDLELHAQEMPAYDDPRYPYLRLVDRHDITVFNCYQMASVLPEVEQLAHERPSPGKEQLLEIARECASNVNTYLWLIGD